MSEERSNIDLWIELSIFLISFVLSYKSIFNPYPIWAVLLLPLINIVMAIIIRINDGEASITRWIFFGLSIAFYISIIGLIFAIGKACGPSC